MVSLIQNSPSSVSESQVPVKYTFTELAETGNDFTSFSQVAFNNQGVVAFSAKKQGSADIAGIYTSDGQAITTIADFDTLAKLLGDAQPTKIDPTPVGSTELSRSYFFDGNVAINNLGNVLFGAGVNFQIQLPYYFNLSGVNVQIKQPFSYNNASKRLFLTQGDTINLVATVNDMDGYVAGMVMSTENTYSALGVNDSGKIVYALNTQISAGREYSTTSINGVQEGVRPPNGPPVLAYDPVIDNQGNIYFLKADAGSGKSQIIRLGRESDVPVTDKNFSARSLFVNPQGTVFFTGFDQAGNNGTYKIDNGVVTPVSDSGSYIEINNSGELDIAFVKQSSTGIFTDLEKVIAPGDPLLDSTVAKVKYVSNGLNALGEVAFIADLTNGTEGVFRADPVTATSYTGGNNDLIFTGLGQSNISTPIDIGVSTQNNVLNPNNPITLTDLPLTTI